MRCSKICVANIDNICCVNKCKGQLLKFPVGRTKRVDRMVRKMLYEIALKEFDEDFVREETAGTPKDCPKADRCIHGAKCPYDWYSLNDYYSCFERIGTSIRET